jgi:catechol 2,3-dioxygenase-like lactoylglutathione lyase family enzyme
VVVNHSPHIDAAGFLAESTAISVLFLDQCLLSTTDSPRDHTQYHLKYGGDCMENTFDGIIPFYGSTDLVKTSHFYESVLGLSLYKDQGACRIYRVTSTGYIGFCTHLPVMAAERSPIITLLTEDVDAVYRRIRDAGWDTEDIPKENQRFKIYHFYTRDPDGHAVEIQRFLD